ncbi:HAD-IIB family hydrolase [Tolypothrix sp. PCC 7910]|uniref:HAD-IIB family hydrolase n=1 Tax=Tolypothrix sp. PCC 7910 TaxID=2099387 RepID=UPI0014278C32|nr:HAD-IIB family hydrolase [Tolypothrix sp. PCC 7910]QIR35927.1 HAD-IIB family hydrolase [Tolypothrix sp. PCC 7910]
MSNTIYISDLDGTLLTNNAVLSDYSKHKLQELLQDGLMFTVASARSVVFMGVVLRGLKLPLPIVEFNGAFISDLESGRHEIINSIETEIIEDIYQLICSFKCVPFISSFNGSEDCCYYQQIINEGMQWYINDRLLHQDERLRAIANFTDAFCDQIVCITIINHKEIISELEIAIHERYGDRIQTYHYENSYNPGWYWLTIYSHKATKAQAILTLQAAYGLKNSKLTVFGDHNNDIEMFQIADCAIAVANATVELQRHATHVIDSNQADSVVRYIHQDWTQRSLLKLV